MARVISKTPVSELGPSWPSCLHVPQNSVFCLLTLSVHMIIFLLQVKPPNIGYKGRPPVTIIGTNLGTVKDTIKDIRVGSLNCTSVEFKRIDGDFDVEINKE